MSSLIAPRRDADGHLLASGRRLGAWTPRLLAFMSLLAFTLGPGGAPRSAHAATTNQNPFCSRLGKSIGGSSGAYMYCFGAQPTTGGTSSSTSATKPATVVQSSPTTVTYSTNVNAANPAEDISPSGVRVYGQSETSIAASGPYVVEAWNDGTGFFSPCPSPMYKEELTGAGFSNNGGASFTDLGGLPNNCSTGYFIFGDPSVGTYTSGGSTYFYITSLYFNAVTFLGPTYIALTVCKVDGTGSSATLSCGLPIKAAASSECTRIRGKVFCSFLDKDFLTVDPQRKRLYIDYTDFGVTPASPIFNGAIDLAVCDLSNPAAPVCENGSQPAPAAPYFVVAAGNPNCENEGAYPAVDEATGDVYVAWEFNWATNFLTPACLSVPTEDKVARVPFSCLTLTASSSCGPPATTNAVNVISIDAAFIPGYNRFPANDFPRIAVSDTFGTVSIVWNDTRTDTLGDILLQSFNLGTLSTVQSSPVKLNNDSSTTGTLHFLPGLRNADAAGNLNVSWYDRRNQTPTTSSGLTDVYAANDVNPRATTTPATNTKVTDQPSDWLSVSTDIIPNFGDYTDSYVDGSRDYAAWSDGRLHDPQPFEAHASVN